MDDKPRMPGERVKERILISLARQRQLRNALATDLGQLKTTLAQISGIDLHETAETLKMGRAEVEKATRQIERIQRALMVAGGHAQEMLGIVSDEKNTGDLIDALTVVLNDGVYARYHAPTVVAVLGAAELDVITDAIRRLNPERRAVILAALEDANATV